MDNKKKIIFLIFLGISIIIGVIIVIIFFPNIFSSMQEASAISIIGGADSPTTIYIAAKYNWKLTLVILLLLFTLDYIILTIINTIEHVKVKKIKLIYKAIFISLFNLSLTLLLFPGVFLWSILLTVIMIIMIYTSGLTFFRK